MPRAIACATKNVPRKIRVEHQVPVVPGDIQRRLADIAAGVVHQDVDLRKCRVDLLGHAGDAGVIAHVECDGMRAAAKRFDLGNKWREIIGPATGEDKVRAGTRQRARKVLPEAAAGSSDKRDLAGEIEQ